MTRSVVLLGFAMLFGCASQSTSLEEEDLSPKQRYMEAEEARQKGDNATALAGFLPLVEKEGVWATQAKLGIARMAMDNGDYEEALRGFELVLDQDPASLDAQEGRGLALLALGDQKLARRQLENVYRQDSKRWRTLNGLGVLADLRGNYEHAARWYGQALDIGGQKPSILNNAGYSLIMAGNYEEAETLLVAAVRRFPEAHRLRHNLAIAQARQGHYTQAIYTWEATLDEADALNNAGYVAMLNGDKKQAKAFFERALDTAPQHRPRAAANLEAVE